MSQAQLLPAEHFSPSVFLSEGRPATTSLAIAERFGKRHANVVRDIRNLCAELPEGERELKFELTFRIVAGPNNSERQEEFFTVFFDGFILLVMGYTGKKALQVKLVYISAFNAMKEKLDTLAAEERTRLAGDVKELSASHQAHLKAIVDAKVGMLPVPVQRKAYGEIWSRFNRHFQIVEYAQLPVERMAEARDYLIELQPKALTALSPAAPSLAPLDESACLSLAESFAAAHRQVKELSRTLRIRMYAVENVIEENLVRAGYYGRKGNGCPLGNALSGYLAAMCDQALLYPGEELPSDRNPGYLLRDIVRQVNAGMRARG